jgi:hypothetical protein
MQISLSKAPKLGESAELTFHVAPRATQGSIEAERNLENSRAWVEFVWANTQGSYSEAKYGVQVPTNEVLVKGNLTWSGNARETKDIDLVSTVQLPREGFWKIYGYFSSANSTMPLRTQRAVIVTKDAAGILGTPEFSSGPLAYLGNFSYGTVSKPTLDERHPVTVELDISKAPRAGEEATITCRVASLGDVPNFSVELRFFRRSGQRVPADNLLVSGNGTWSFDLKAGTPVNLSTKVKFPDPDDWRIEVVGNSLENINAHMAGFADYIPLSVRTDKSSFGWEERPITGTGTFPPGRTVTGIPPRGRP